MRLFADVTPAPALQAAARHREALESAVKQHQHQTVGILVRDAAMRNDALIGRNLRIPGVYAHHAVLHRTLMEHVTASSD
jgi:hypothetical protein